MIASPGNKVIYGEYRMKSLPSASMEPHSGRGGCTPIPIKLIPAAVSIILPTPMVAWMMMGPIALGRICFTMM